MNITHLPDDLLVTIADMAFWDDEYYDGAWWNAISAIGVTPPMMYAQHILTINNSMDQKLFSELE